MGSPAGAAGPLTSSAAADRALLERVGGLLTLARSKATTPEAAQTLQAAGQRLSGPLRIAIAGKVKAGKSTLLNALLGEELAPTDAGECTKIVTWYAHGDQPHVRVHPRGAEPVRAGFRRSGGALEVDLDGRAPEDVERIEVFWPTGRLKELTFVDTPGIASLSTDVAARTLALLNPEDDRAPEVDAIIYLLRHMHSEDVRFLESFHDDELARGTPMNAVGVLSRADEIGSCRLDAMETADRVASRYAGDPRLRRLCQVVVPVGGLLGYAGGTLREAEFRALATVAAAPPDVAGELLLTADRFAYRPAPLALTEIERLHLLDRLGLFGIRLAVDLLQHGVVHSATGLAVELTRRSGLTRLRQVLLRQFADRAMILKAMSALAAVTAVVHAGGCEDPDLFLATAEQITSGAHAFEEVRLLDRLRTGELEMPGDSGAELDRLVGGSGHDPASRLGLPDDAPVGQVRAAALDALGRWRSITENPLAARAVQNAARSAVRSLEGVLMGLAAPVAPGRVDWGA